MEIIMTDIELELAERLKERVMFGGISGGEQKSPPNYSSIPAGGIITGVIFDQDIYDHNVQTEAGLAMHSIMAKDGREAYFEVNENEKLYSFLSFGLNVEIWKSVLVIGDPSYKDNESWDREHQPREHNALEVINNPEHLHRVADVLAWITEEEPDARQRRALARTILRAIPDGAISYAPFSIHRKGDEWTIAGSKSFVVFNSAAEVEQIMAAIAWADAIELDLRDRALF
jgi:hypothetical protein